MQHTVAYDLNTELNWILFLQYISNHCQSYSTIDVYCNVCI